MGPLSKEQRNDVVCALIGHSKIIYSNFGYALCGRCRAQIGDSLAGGFSDPEKKFVVVGHGCSDCRTAEKKLTWQDRLYAPPHPLRKSEARK